jgi:hypothetical protein
MKIRVGFVSNSSSSSFLILGQDIEIINVTFKMIKEKDIYVIGTDLTDGSDIFKIKSIEMLAFMKAVVKVKGKYDFHFVESFATGNDDFEGEIDVDNLPKTGKIKYFALDKDNRSSSDLSDLRDRYNEYDDGEVDREMQKYLREKKLKKLENIE